MKLNIYANQDLTSLKIFDFYYAYVQSQNKHRGYQSSLEITITDQPTTVDNAINIAMVYMPEHSVDDLIEKFDLVFFDNQHHPLEICTEVIVNNIQKHQHCYFINGARLMPNHPLQEKFIYLDLDTSMQYLGQAQYPQYYEIAVRKNATRKGMTYINGQNRTNRQFFMEMIEHIVPCRNAWPRMSSMFESFFEDQYDQEFRTDMNSRYEWEPDASEWSQNQYYAESVQLGIDGKFGTLSPGYFLLDEYFDYHSVIYSDTCWLNNQLFLSEKLGKCIVAGAIPWPVGGANLNRLYFEAGYLTAWSLLPSVLQLYDENLNHAERMRQTAHAIDWVSQHPEIWDSTAAKEIRVQNISNFYNKRTNLVGVQKLDQILKDHERRH
jgi:hypothetical protein